MRYLITFLLVVCTTLWGYGATTNSSQKPLLYDEKSLSAEEDEIVAQYEAGKIDKATVDAKEAIIEEKRDKPYILERMNKICQPDNLKRLMAIITDTTTDDGCEPSTKPGDAILELGGGGSIGAQYLIRLVNDPQMYKNYPDHFCIALGYTGDTGALACLIYIATHEKNERLRVSACSNLTDNCSEYPPESKDTIFHLLINYVDSSNPNHREMCAKGLGKLGDPAAIPYLEKLKCDDYKTKKSFYDDNPNNATWYPVKDAAIKSLTRIKVLHPTVVKP